MKDAKYLLSAKAIREQTLRVYNHVREGHGEFVLEESKLDEVAERVVGSIRARYPQLEIPYHSRWGHFKVGGDARLKGFLNGLPKDQIERCRRCFELAITSVLLDAGAGAEWMFREGSSGQTFRRSEGLAVASLEMFQAGDFSSISGECLADGKGLSSLSISRLNQAFQVSETNPLVGAEGRVDLINRLGQAVEEHPEFVGKRLGGLVDTLLEESRERVQAHDILLLVLHSMGSIWPGRVEREGVNLGDVWEYDLGGELILVPFHKLSQWLTYSLIEPLEWMGVEVQNLDELTGLAEYRNGGLFVDTGVIRLRDEKQVQKAHHPSSRVVVEWRALTLTLLDRLAPMVRERLGKSESEFPLARVLEGGTWHAGREIAREKRESGEPPIQIESDGTVF